VVAHPTKMFAGWLNAHLKLISYQWQVLSLAKSNVIIQKIAKYKLSRDEKLKATLFLTTSRVHQQHN
jgi:hypothetical protein